MLIPLEETELGRATRSGLQKSLDANREIFKYLNLLTHGSPDSCNPNLIALDLDVKSILLKIFTLEEGFAMNLPYSSKTQVLVVLDRSHWKTVITSWVIIFTHG